MTVIVGQRYFSESEPELGAGIVTSVENKYFQLTFSESNSTRTYGINSSPVQRIIFEEGDAISTKENSKLTVKSIEEKNGLNYYCTNEGLTISESEIIGNFNSNKPYQKLHLGKIDSPTLFNLRYKTIQENYRMQKNKIRGFIGGKLDLIPHQFYVASQICYRENPRVLLSDEVGLGKTIEAGLAIFHLVTTEKVNRVLIVVPDSLVYQWFIELYKKFHLTFTTLNQETHLEENSNPFLENELVIVNIGLLKGSKIAMQMILEAKWDLVVVDEAHQLKWKQEKASIEYTIVQKIAEMTKGLFLLTATPLQLGLEGHFGRLHLIDPERFNNFDQFTIEQNEYQKLAETLNSIWENKELSEKLKLDQIKNLQDLHGTGRIFFRNTRDRLSKTNFTFPNRIAVPHPISNEIHLNLNCDFHENDIQRKFFIESKIDWLIQFLEKTSKEKILLISKSKSTILEIQEILNLKIPFFKIALFHSGLTFIERDKEAAFFNDSLGAQILLCTEVGSEGRNFEVAPHLILFDIPSNPEILEQRIGRLDRIGQKNNIHIHIPYLLNSFEEILFQWHHKGMNAFSESAKGSGTLYQNFQLELDSYLLTPSILLNSKTHLEQFIEKTQKSYQEIINDLEKGRDKLLEFNSFNEQEALKITEEIAVIDNEKNLYEFMNLVFHVIGVEFEDLDNGQYFIKPHENMSLPHFPHLNREGMNITFNRKIAIKKEETTFITWDHPMVLGIINLLMGQSLGNFTLMKRQKSNSSKIFFEMFFILFPIANKNLGPDQFFPPTPLRVLLDSEGNNYSSKWNKEEIEEKIIPSDRDCFLKAKKIPIQLIKNLINKAILELEPEIKTIKQSVVNDMQENLNFELNRLIQLQKINKSVRMDEIKQIEEKINIFSKSFLNANVKLDAMRIIY